MKQNWLIKKMPEVVKWGSGGTPKATVKEYYENGDIPWLIIGDLNDEIVLTSESKITKLGLENSSAKMIPKGTLLVAMYGSIGKLGITGIECCTNDNPKEKDTIDHIDGNKANNSVYNLRWLSLADNIKAYQKQKKERLTDE